MKEISIGSVIHTLEVQLSGNLMKRFFANLALLCHASKAIGAAGLLFALCPWDADADEPNIVAPEPSLSVEQRKRIAQDRHEEIRLLLDQLKEAKSPQDRRDVIEKFRSKLATDSKTPSPASQAPETASKSLARLQQQIAAHPEVKERLASIEARLKAIQELKEAMDAASKADPKDRGRLMEEVSKRRSELMKAQEATFAEARTVSSESQARQVPPEMAAMREKSEQRKREIETFKEALTKASTPEERTKLLEEWRARRQEEMNRQLAEVPR